MLVSLFQYKFVCNFYTNLFCFASIWCFPGNNRRAQAATAANEVSSRSHAVLQVLVECRDKAPGKRFCLNICQRMINNEQD